MLDDTLVLDTWSSGTGSSSPVLPLLALARPDLDADQRGGLPGDEANRSLLATMAELGEHALDTLVACPRCDEPNQVVLPIEVLTAVDGGPVAPVLPVVPVVLTTADGTGPVADADRPDGRPDGSRPLADTATAGGTGPLADRVTSDSRPVRYRVPSVDDLEAARRCAHPEEAERLLVDRCLGPGVDRSELATLAAELDERHPLLAPRVEVRCVSCDSTFEAGLDVAGLVWASVSAAATRLVDEVAHLARGCGWSEAEVLAVPRARREVYRRLIDDGLL